MNMATMMNDPRGFGQAQRDGAVGLCGRCAHAQVIVNDRGSEFYLCRLSATDPRFPRYPTLPVVACPGFVDGAPGVKR
jgi:hypothetical protein